MHECLNKRRGKTHETSLNEQTELQEKLQERNPRKQKKLQNSPNERRRPFLEKRRSRRKAAEGWKGALTQKSNQRDFW